MPGDQDPAFGPPKSGELNVVLTLRFKPGTVQTVLDGILPLVAPTRAESGNVRFDVFQVTAKPDTLIILERWKDLGALEQHWALPSTKTVLDLFEAHLTEPLEDGGNVLYLSDMTK